MSERHERSEGPRAHAEGEDRMSDKNGSSGGKPDVDALRAEIKQTRADLGETVQALAAKADVKARAKEQVEQTKQKVRAQAAEATEKVRDAAMVATDKVRHAAAQAGAAARGTAEQATDRVKDSGALDKAQGAGEQVRRNPIPLAAVLVAAVAVVGVILVIRGRRR
jgi:cobalamin biosynthesis Mg chelatase CobN